MGLNAIPHASIRCFSKNIFEINLTFYCHFEHLRIFALFATHYAKIIKCIIEF